MKAPARSRGQARLRSRFSMVLPLERYLHAEAASGYMLIAGAALALAWANSRWAGSYHAVWDTPIGIDLHLFALQKSLHHWVNDGLMVLFFLLIGVELKSELANGQLSTPSKAALPAIAAAGGILVPALLYAALAVRGGGEALRGWGVPVATDIAFALGILALLGPRVPVQLRVFLMALATVDDIGGILIIAVFYTSTISWTALAVGLLIAAALFAMRWIRPVNAGIYGLLGVLLWLAFLKSGIHATIAGVVFGLIAPAKRFYSLTEVEETSEIMDRELRAAIEAGDEERADLFLGQLEEMAKSSEQPARRLERFVRPWVSYVVLPIFSLANAGIELSWPGLKAACLDPVGQAITAGLLVGKPIGIVLFTLLAVRLGWSRLPEQVRTSHLIGTGILAGIGFTVSLFIAGLAFEGPHLDVAKLAVLGVSVLAATAGGGFLYLASARGTAAGSTAA